MAQRGFGSRRRLCAMLVAAVGLAAGGVRGDVVGGGDVVPTDPLTWTSATTGYVGKTADGSVTVNANSKLVSSTGYVGYGVGANGTVFMNGTGSTWTNSWDLIVGYSGNGMISVTGGGKLSDFSGYLGYATGAVGKATVDGSGSTWTNATGLAVGYSGTGTLTITNGGKVIHVSSIGSNAGATGAVTVDGAGSTLSGVGEVVGRSGAGILAISNGGSVDCGDGITFLGERAGSAGTVTVDGAGSKWTCGSLTVGHGGAGLLMITHGGFVSSSQGGELGVNAGSSGTVTVDGAGSTWACSGSLTVGEMGSGALNITHGGVISVSGETYVGDRGVNFGDQGGTLVAGTYWGSPTSAVGFGTINTHGLINDGVLVFDKTHGLDQTLMWTNDQGNVTVNLTASGGSLTLLGVGNSSTGTMAIRDGVKVTSGPGMLGGGDGSSGTATVDGAGSMWTCNGNLTIGNLGLGTLAITHGGAVSCSADGVLGWGSGFVTVDGTGSTWTCGNSLTVESGIVSVTKGGSMISNIAVIGGDNLGTVTLDGAGSTWKCSGSLTLGFSSVGILKITHGGAVTSNSVYLGAIYGGGRGRVTVDGPGSSLTCGYLYINGGGGAVNIANGGIVTTPYLRINKSTLLTMNVGDNSALNLGGSGILTNSGIVRLVAVPGATAGTYTPISVGSGTLLGTFQALGGKWNRASHVFTVSAAQAGVPGAGVTIDRLAQQRVVITDAIGGDCVQAGFSATTSSTNLTLSAIGLTDVQEAALLGVVPAGQGVLDGWTFTTSGYTAGDPVYLSMKVGSLIDAGTLAVWHYDRGVWKAYATSDLSYDGAYASFTVTGFSGYAVTGVPEPASLVMVALGAVVMLRRRRRGG